MKSEIDKLKQENETLKKEISTLQKEKVRLQKENSSLVLDKRKIILDLKQCKLNEKELRIKYKEYKMKSDEKIRSLETEIIKVKKSRPTVAELMSNIGRRLDESNDEDRTLNKELETDAGYARHGFCLFFVLCVSHFLSPVPSPARLSLVVNNICKEFVSIR